MSQGDRQAESAGKGRTVVQWIAGGIGLTLTLALVALVAWRAIKPGELTPPSITVSVEHVHSSGAGYLVAFVARNSGDQTAAEVTVEGTLTASGTPEETSSATLNYVPGGSQRTGGLFFTSDPRKGKLDLRALRIYDSPKQ